MVTVLKVQGNSGRSKRLAILPAGEVQAASDQAHDSGLKGGGREHRRQGLWHAFQAVCDGDEDGNRICEFESTAKQV